MKVVHTVGTRGVEQFKNIYNNFEEWIPIEGFSKVGREIIILMEYRDSLIDLLEIGINSEKNDLLGTTL